MDYLANIGIGVLVSAGLFIFTYKQTIGARKERTKSTHSEIIRMLLRDLVNGNYIPTIPEINRIIQTKSDQNKINTTDLPDEMGFIYALYTRVAEDEILSSIKRREFIRKINKFLEEAEKKTLLSSEEEKTPLNQKERYRIFLVALSSIVVAMFTVFLFAFLKDRTISTVNLSNLLLVSITIMVTMLSIITIFIKLKEESEKSTIPPRGLAREYKDFEDRIYKTIKEFGKAERGFFIREKDRMFRFDFCLQRKNKTFLIETRMIRSYLPRFIVEKLRSLAKLAKKIDKKYILILVVSEKRYLAPYLDELNKDWDYVFNEVELKKFRNRLFHG